MDTEYFKKNFCFTFQPKREMIKPILRAKKDKRFNVQADNLPKYIGQQRTDFILKKVVEMKADKKRFKIQNIGILDVYCI